MKISLLQYMLDRQDEFWI